MKGKILKEPTTILVEKKTRARLVKLGSKSETYNEIIIRLLTAYEEGLAAANIRGEVG
jgi:hypothetical protein